MSRKPKRSKPSGASTRGAVPGARARDGMESSPVVAPAEHVMRPLPTLGDERIQRIADMMAGGEWLGRQSHRELAEEWGVGVSMVAHYATMASRLLRLDPAQVQALQADTLGRLTRIASAAEQQGELRAAVSALAERAKIAGAVAPSRVHHSGSVHRPIPDALAEAGARARELSEADRARLVGLGYGWLLAWTLYTTREDGEVEALALLGVPVGVATSDGSGDT